MTKMSTLTSRVATAAVGDNARRLPKDKGGDREQIVREGGVDYRKMVNRINTLTDADMKRALKHA
jgi:hypothetical protein